MRVLAVDFGFKQIGLAVGESGFNLGSPRVPIKAKGALKADAESIGELARKEEVQMIVVGLPVEESGQEGRMARICRTLGGHLVQLGFVVEYADERYTSIEAEAELSSAGVNLRRQKDLVHGEAAMLILERFWHEKKAD